MKSRALGAVGAIVVAIVAGNVLLRQPRPAPDRFIYLMDARSDTSAPLEQALPVIEQLEGLYSARTYSTKVIVRSAASVDPLRDYRSMFAEFDRTRNPSERSPVFFLLERPYATATKALRASIDERSSFHATSRIEFLRSLVVVRDTETLNERAECRQLDDDILYAQWNFLGIALLVHDGTLEHLKTCIDALALARVTA